MATKSKKRPAKKSAKPSASVTGKYVYDAATDRIVKVSDRIPSVASRSSSGGDSPCGGGACGPMGGGCQGPCAS